MWLTHTFTTNARLYGSKVALKEGDRTVTYKELEQRTNALIKYFRSVGLQKGDRVAVLSKNSIEVIETLVSCFKCGMIGVPLNHRLTPEKIAYILTDCTADALVISPEFTGFLSSKLYNTKNLKTMLVTNEPCAGLKFYNEVVEQLAEANRVKLEDQDPAAIIYTSGTTGNPKGVTLSRRALLEVAKLFCLELNIEVADRTLNVMPLFHSGGLAWALSHLCRGATGVVLSDFQVKHVLEVMDRERISSVHLVPTMIAMMLREADIARYDFSTLKTILYAGSSMPLPLLKKAMEVFGPNKFVQMYGQTEHGPTISCLSRQEHILAVQPDASQQAKELLTSCGLPMLNVNARIMQNGQEVPLGEIGEITCRGESMMNGYWNNPDLTKKKIVDGWLYTGDMGKMDKNGYIYIVDRKEDMIISGGENVYPSEVESVIYEHPAVAEVAVVGQRDEIWGERTVAAVTIRDGFNNLKEEELIEWCRGRIAGYARPRNVYFFEELPKSAAGKVLRKVLREQFQQ